MRRALRILWLSLFLLVLCVDVLDIFVLFPVVHHAPSDVNYYIRHGLLGIHRMPPEYLEALVQEGRRKLTIGSSGAPAGGYGGISMPLLWLEFIFGALTGRSYIAPRWRRYLRRRYGLCERCGYPLRGLESDRCPECGAPFDPAGRAAPKPKPTTRAVRWVHAILPVLAPCMLIWGFSSLLSLARPSLEESWADLTPPNPNAFLIDTGNVVVIRKNGGLGRVQVFHSKGPVFFYRANYWVDKDSASTQPSDTSSEGILQAFTNSMPIIVVGPWRLEWSIGDEDHYWIYRADETFDLSVEVAESP